MLPVVGTSCPFWHSSRFHCKCQHLHDEHIDQKVQPALQGGFFPTGFLLQVTPQRCFGLLQFLAEVPKLGGAWCGVEILGLGVWSPSCSQIFLDRRIQLMATCNDIREFLEDSDMRGSFFWHQQQSEIRLCFKVQNPKPCIVPMYYSSFQLIFHYPS